MRLLRTLFGDRRAASAAEFALVLPLLMIMLFGIIDAGRFLWLMNKSEKATQMGVRMAVVTDPVSPDLVDEDYAAGGLDPGDLIPASALGTLTCTSTGCTCDVSPCPSGGSVDATAFGVIVARMQAMNPLIQPQNVAISYSGSGFGYAGSAVSGGGGGGGGATETMEIDPLVTVRVTGIQMDFISTLGILDINMPAARATLTAEDSSGTFSN